MLGTVLANVRPIQLRSLVIGVVVIALAVGGSLIGLSQAHAVADHLTVTTAAASATVTSGAAFTTQPVIAIQNSSNVTDVTVTDTVYAAVSTGATLVGAGKRADVQKHCGRVDSVPGRTSRIGTGFGPVLTAKATGTAVAGSPLTCS